MSTDKRLIKSSYVLCLILGRTLCLRNNVALIKLNSIQKDTGFGELVVKKPRLLIEALIRELIDVP